MNYSDTKKIYFASDFHLGVPDFESSLAREKIIVSWLDSIKHDASELFLVGDLFDFWFEYKHVIPKGFSRLIGKLCELQDAGIDVHLFHGNHDLWQFGYFEKEIGCKVHPKPIQITRNKKTFYIAHGDGLGPNQQRFKFVLSIYRNRVMQRLFAMINPSFGIGLANWLSRNSKLKTFEGNKTYLGDEKEHLVIHATQFNELTPTDFFVFGHRHLPFYRTIKNTHIINLGDWFSYNSYAVFDGSALELKYYSNNV